MKSLYRSLSRPARTLYLQALEGYGKLRFFPVGEEEPRSEVEKFREQMLTCKGGWSL